MSAAEARLSALGIVLPEVTPPVANYVPWVISGHQLFISGQLPFHKGALITGKVGRDITMAQGIHAAGCCALAVLSQAKVALGNLDRVARVIKLTGFVNADDTFGEQSDVMNGPWTTLLMSIL